MAASQRAEGRGASPDQSPYAGKGKPRGPLAALMGGEGMKGRAPLGQDPGGSPRSTVQKALSGWRGEENVVHPHKVMVFILEKEGHSDTCCQADEPRGHYAQGKKLVTERKTPCDYTWTGSLESLHPKGQEGGSGASVKGMGLIGPECWFCLMRPFWDGWCDGGCLCH